MPTTNAPSESTDEDESVFGSLSNFGADVPAAAEALGQAARARLAAGDSAAAFAFADRRCRLIVPSARDLLLRAHAHKAAGRLEAAQRDLREAILLDPTDLAVDRAALAWGEDKDRREAAKRLARRPALAAPLRRRALASLFEAERGVAHDLRRTSQGVAGWVAWPEGETLRINLPGAGEASEFGVDADPDHPLATVGVAVADVAIEFAEAGPLALDLFVADDLAEAVRLAPFAKLRSPAKPLRKEEADEPFLTIIVPVYEDFETTRACLESLETSRPSIAHEIIVVDDASPNSEIRRYLDDTADDRFTLFRNAANLGFAAAVNLALSHVTHGDVLLLNADTLLAPGSIERLWSLSRSSPGVGTLTPFSNNGELTSYPLRNEVNPLPSASEVQAIDVRAREANGDALVDLPNGIGFCLYITEPCLDAVGGLPELYAQGYYEDVEFCLAARERGFRNVAAPGVFVGHAGSKSFAARKRPLVMRNLQLLEARYPGYRLETAAFVALDPLKPYRAALDRALAPTGRTIIVASGPKGAAAWGLRRAKSLKAEQPQATVLTMAVSARGDSVSVSAVGGGAPQSLNFAFEANDAEAFVAYLGKLDVARMEWLDPASFPDVLLAALAALPVETDLLCADLNWFSAPIVHHTDACASPGANAPCEVCRDLAAPRTDESDKHRLRRLRLGRALERADRIVPLDRMAESFAQRVFKSRAAPFEGAVASQANPRGAAIAKLGVLYPHRSPSVDVFLLSLGRRLAAGGNAQLVVFGASLDDAALMATNRIFVTGPVAREDYVGLARDHGVDALLAPDRGGGYGDLEASAAELGAAKAYFDWSFGAFAVEDRDLSLDPRICDDKAATAIVDWLKGERWITA